MISFCTHTHETAPTKNAKTYHLHRRENGNRVALGHLAALLDTHFDNHSADGRADLAAVARVGLGAALVLHRRLVVVHRHLSDLAVHLVEDLALPSVLTERSDCQQLEDKHLALLQLNIELLANLRARQKVPRRQHAEVAVLVDPLAIVLKDLGVHGIRRKIRVGDGAKLLLELLLGLGKVKRLEVEAGTLVHLAPVTEGVRAEGLGETAVRLSHEAFEEFQNGTGEVELLGLFLYVLEGELVRDHELREVTNNFGCGRDLDNVAKEVVSLSIGFFRLRPLCTEAELRSLEDEVGELASWYLVHIDISKGIKLA